MAASEVKGPRVDIVELIDAGGLKLVQFLTLFFIATAVIVDGFDLQLIGLALPQILKEWSVDRHDLAPVIAGGLFSMAVGSIVGGYLGDRIGRRWAIILNVFTFGVFTAITAFPVVVNDTLTLAVCRVIAAFGLGGVTPNALALVAECSPARLRSGLVSLVVACSPIGGISAGVTASVVLPESGWRSLFLVGGLIALVVGVILIIALPESPRFLTRRPSRRPQLVAFLKRIGHAPPENATFVDSTDKPVERGRIAALLAPGLKADSLLVWMASFCTSLSIFSLLSWGPTFLTSQNVPAQIVPLLATTFDMGSLTGILIGSSIIGRLGSRRVLLTTSGIAFLMAIGLRFVPIGAETGHDLIRGGFFILGACLSMTVAGVYSVGANIYPTEARSTGMGATTALGRTGAILSSFFGARMLDFGSTGYFGMIAVAMGVGFLCLLAIRRHVPPRLTKTTAVLATT